MKKLFFLSIISILASAAFADARASVIQLRDLLYEQELNEEEILPYYENTLSEIKTELSETDPCECFALSARTEYLMGRTFQLYNQGSNACTHYENGIAFADQSLKIRKNPLSYLMKAECISQMCAIKQSSYAMSNGLKVGSYADDVLELEEHNTAALYLKASRWIYAPAVFADQGKGRKILNANFQYLNPENRDDVFNFNLAMGYSFLRSKKKADALTYLEKAQAVYPTNKYCASLIKEASE